MRNVFKTIRSICYLAEYFEKNYIDPDNEEDKNLNSYKYAIEALSNIIPDEEDLDFEALLTCDSYKHFVIVFEEKFLDQCADLFESR